MSSGVTFNGQRRPDQPMAKLAIVVAGGIRLEIVRSLLDASKDVTTLANELQLDISLISHNLRLLRENGLVQVRRWGRHHVYGVTDQLHSSANGQFVELEVRSLRGERLVFHLLPD